MSYRITYRHYHRLVNSWRGSNGLGSSPPELGGCSA